MPATCPANIMIAVDMGSMLIVATNTARACNDKQQVEPILERLDALPVVLGKPDNLVADTGYFSEANINACSERKITALLG